MKKTLFKNLSTVLMTLVVSCISLKTSAQLLAWDFQGATANGSVNATTNSANLNTSSVSRGAGISFSSLADAYSSSGFEGTTLADAITKNEYLEFSISPKTNYKVSLSSLESSFRRSATGPASFQWQYSLDGFQTAGTNIGSEITFTSTATNGEAMPSIPLSGISALQNVSSPAVITIRLYGYNASSTTGTFAIGKPTTPTIDLAILGPVVLPVDLTSFNVKPLGNSVFLSWSTASERSNKQFTVERSEDKTNFYAVGKVNGAGSSDAQQSYSYTDYLVENKEYYYRLKQSDIDGESSYSDVKSVKVLLAKAESFSIFPNPVSKSVTIASTTNAKDVSLKLTDISGKLLLSKQGSVEVLNQSLNSVLANLLAGSYFIQLSDGSNSIVNKIIKE